MFYLIRENKKEQGFTLIELSIVLVILGLLAGGILSGQSLIRAAELRATSQEVQQYMVAVNTFRDKYHGVPGDLNNATRFWGEAHATPATCRDTASTGKETCDGNGDGYVARSDGSSEQFRFWQHLSNAGIISGSYTGVNGSTGQDHHDIGVNVPQGKMGDSGWSAYHFDSAYGSTPITNDFGNILIFGSEGMNSSGVVGKTWDNVFIPAELWNIDRKFDDGRAATGQIRAYQLKDCTDTEDATNKGALYELEDERTLCTALFKGIF